MIEVKILARGKYSPEDISVNVGESNRKIDPAIEAQIEELWEKKLKTGQDLGKKIYNGKSYRLNFLTEQDGKLMLGIGVIEYKTLDGLVEIPEYFNLPEEYWRKGCFTGATVKTKDGKYLMVELSGKSMNINTLDQLGGILELPPEISNGADIFTSLYQELVEEAFIQREDIVEIFLKAVFLGYLHNVGLYFEVVLSATSEELLERYKTVDMEIDIKSIKFLERTEYVEILEAHSPSKKLIASLLEI